MVLNILKEGASVIKDGVYYFVLQQYPQIQEWEWNNIRAFISYEKRQKRSVEILCENQDILIRVKEEVLKLDGTEYIPPISSAVEEFVYHATNVSAAQKIFYENKLLAATKVYKKTGNELALERREIGWEDPPDFYEYIMLGWGSHLVGDYVVLSEEFPPDEDLEKGNFDAGVRFYFRYEDMLKHEGHIFDGYHAIKIRDEMILSDYLYACIVPEQFRQQIEDFIPQRIISKVHYLPQRGIALQEWNQRVVEFINRK